MAQKALAIIIGERLRMFRKKKGLSQEELAHLSCLHPTYIGQLERGEKNATLNTVEKVTKSLEISIEELFHFSKQHDSLLELELHNYLHTITSEDLQKLSRIIDIIVEWKELTNKKSPI